MAQYSPRKLVRSVSKSLLQRYFSNRGLLGEFDWAKYKEGDPGPIVDALEAMPVDERESV